MLALQRQNKILSLLKQYEYLTVKNLCSNIYASEATIRRDIRALAVKKVIKKVHGGITLCSGSNTDIPSLIRFDTNVEKKKHIAQIAARYIKNSATIFIDASSTCAYLASILDRFSDLTIVTNGIHSMNILNKHASTKLFACGGLVTDRSALTGTSAFEFFNQFRADILFMSCGGLSLSAGITEATLAQASVKKTMIKNARQRILLCDSDKMNGEFFCKICEFDEIDLLLTDARPPEDIMHILGNKIVYE